MPGLRLLDLYPQSAPQFSSSCQLCTPTPTPNPPTAPHYSGFLHMCGYVATCTLKIGRQLALHSLWLWYAMCPQEDRSREETIQGRDNLGREIQVLCYQENDPGGKVQAVVSKCHCPMVFLSHGKTGGRRRAKVETSPLGGTEPRVRLHLAWAS